MSRTTSSALRTISMVTCVILSAAIAHAQYRASIQGVVTDSQGAVVPGATVKLTDKETNRTLIATSGETGVYNFNALPPSRYSMTVEKAGFKKKVLDNVTVIAEQANALNVQLDVGATSETVEVNADQMPLIDTETSNLSGTVTAKQIQKLPSFGRDVFQLLQLAPGAFGDGAQAAGGGTQNLPADSIGGTGGTDGAFKIENGGQISANGARPNDNNYQIDGVGTTSVTWGGESVVTPNEDSVKEVKILTDSYDAENGRYRGAQVQIISQNGTNQYHGSAYFKAHRPGLDAFTKYNGYNSDAPGCVPSKSNSYCGNVRDANRFNDFGGSIGGPILHNKLFAFFSYETLTNKAAQTTGSGWYETSAYRGLTAGPNAAKFFGYPGAGPFGGTQVDQTCAFAGLIDAAHVDASHSVANCVQIAGQGLNIGTPLSAALGTHDAAYGTCYHKDSSGNCTELNWGTGGDGTGGANNLGTTADIAFLTGIRNPTDSSHKQYNGRLDYNVTSKDLITFSIYQIPNGSTSINGNGIRQMNNFSSTSTNHSATLLWNHMFSSSLINEARINGAGWMEKDLASNPNAPWGLPQVSFNALGSLAGGTVQGYGIGSYNGFDQWTYAGKDVLTKVRGAHTIKIGGEYTRLLSEDSPLWSGRPGFTFNNAWDFLNDAPIQENGQFDPQTGRPGAARKDLRSVDVGLFAQDNYKVKPNLTLTLGLRWEYFGPISEIKDHLAKVVLGSGSGLFTDMRVNTGGNLFHAQKWNFGPQLGFAWSPGGLVGHEFNNRLVLRGGFGIAYNGITQSNSLDGRFNPPFVLNGPNFFGSQILYENSFPSNVHSPFGWAPNTAAEVNWGPNNLPTTCCTDLTGFPSRWPTTYTEHYTLTGEYDLGHQWVASVGYQGSQGRHILTHYNLYNPAAANNIAFNPMVHGVSYYGDDGNSRFNALLLEGKHSFGSLLLDTQYRFAHTMDPGSSAYNGPYYQWNTASGFSTSDYDIRHAFKVYGVWSPTIFRGSRSWMEKVAGGWSLSGILNAHTGFPFTPVYALSEVAAQCTVAGVNGGNPGPCEPVFNFGPNGGGGSGDAGTGNIPAAAYAGGFKPNFRSNASIDAKPSFTPPTMVAGTYFSCLFPGPVTLQCPSGGSQPYGPLPTAPGLARNSFRGPGYFDIDATLSKSFGLPNMKVLGEGATLEFRANFYNLFNKLNLVNPQNDIFNAHFGEAQNALGSRTVELQARFNF